MFNGEVVGNGSNDVLTLGSTASAGALSGLRSALTGFATIGFATIGVAAGGAWILTVANTVGTAP